MSLTALVPFRLQSHAVKGNELMSRWFEIVSLSYSPSLETSGVGFEEALLN